MAGENQFVVQCVEIEALLAEALDGTLQGPTLAAFEAHGTVVLPAARWSLTLRLE